MTQLRAKTEREAELVAQTEKRSALNVAISGFIVLLLSLIPGLHAMFFEEGKILLSFGLVFYVLLLLLRRKRK